MSNQEQHIEMTISCPHCEQRQVVHVRASTPSFVQVGAHPVVCVKCQYEFDAPVLDKIIAGPFAK
jgi:C4-type Zn-finger protein